MTAKVAQKGDSRQREAERAGKGAARQIERADGDDGDDGGADAGHGGGHHPAVFKGGVEMCDHGKQEQRRYHHSQQRGDPAGNTGLAVAVEKGHISHEGSRQAARDAGNVQKLLAGDSLLLFNKEPVHLRDDTQSAAEGETA